MLYLFLLTNMLWNEVSASESWMHAQNITELKQIIQQTNIQKQLKTTCLFQLKTNKVPTYCYKWLSYQTDNPKTYVLSYLNEKCQERSTQIKELQRISQILTNPHLSSQCRNQLKSKKQILEYQLRDKPGRQLLKWYFPKHFK